MVVAFRPVRIVILVRTVPSRNCFGETFRHLIVGARIIRTSIGRGYDHFCTVCAEYRALGFGNLVRQGENGAVAALLRHEGKSDAGVAGGRLHNHTARLEFAAAFGRVNDTFRDAIFRGTARIEIFDFNGDGGFDAVGHVVEFDERSVADEFGKGIVDGHGFSLQMIVYWLPMDDFVVFDFEKLAFVTCNFENGTCDGVFTAVHPHMQPQHANRIRHWLWDDSCATKWHPTRMRMPKECPVSSYASMNHAPLGRLVSDSNNMRN